MSFDQLQLDSNVTIGAQQLGNAEQKVKELQVQVEYYERREVEHKMLQTEMRKSYSSFIRDAEELKKQLALAEIRNQELKEENKKLDAQLSGRIDLLLNERQQYTNILEEDRWCEIPRHQVSQMGYYSKHFIKMRVKVDLETNEITTVMPYEPITIQSQ